MTDIDIYVEHLKSRYKITRYDACEELRVMSDLPEKAILALQETVNDPDPMVADAARRALAVYISQSKPDPIDEKEHEREKTITTTLGELGFAILKFCVGFLGFIVIVAAINIGSMLLFDINWFWDDQGYSTSIAIGFVFQLIGFLLATRIYHSKNRWIGIGIFCSIFLFILGAFIHSCIPPLVFPFPFSLMGC